MATPDFVLALREHIGHDLLWMSGVTAIVLDAERRRTLVVRRADTGDWTPVTGIIDPGEQPARAAVREVAEEAALLVRPLRLIEVRTLPETTYANGDRAQYLDLCFVLEHVDGEPRPADGENTEARWADLDDLPSMPGRFRDQIALALEGRAEAVFRA
ncbi:NUDIX domain-containing protein [Brachybacterium sp. MASK1Z-5]|uniref:NUDIX domain-containing protein n=1 Tax=Brachybacterium halotolerans TaxID=2795215 RepID=A0ABS1B5R4_9MICO|nr:NUDIX domain-containing protein [Brachybacterium halotolerans]MBK0329975.1 NUDIX domain-containing protein [Brachybacterium halotolerans]